MVQFCRHIWPDELGAGHCGVRSDVGGDSDTGHRYRSYGRNQRQQRIFQRCKLYESVAIHRRSVSLEIVMEKIPITLIDPRGGGG